MTTSNSKLKVSDRAELAAVHPYSITSAFLVPIMPHQIVSSRFLGSTFCPCCFRVPLLKLKIRKKGTLIIIKGATQEHSFSPAREAQCKTHPSRPVPLPPALIPTGGRRRAGDRKVEGGDLACLFCCLNLFMYVFVYMSITDSYTYQQHRDPNITV